MADNIVEWQRPACLPSRRHSVFANSTRAAACGNVGTAGAYVYEVGLPAGYLVTHLRGYADARHHPSLKDIQRLVHAFVLKNRRDWLNIPWQERGALAALFLPCLSGDEAGAVIRQELPAIEPLLRHAVAAFWNSCETLGHEGVTLQHDGELTFLAPEQGYTLATQTVCPGCP